MSFHTVQLLHNQVCVYVFIIHQPTIKLYLPPPPLLIMSRFMSVEEHLSKCYYVSLGK